MCITSIEVISVYTATIFPITHATHDNKQPQEEPSGLSKTLKYLIHPMTIVDWLSILPYYMSLFSHMGALLALAWMDGMECLRIFPPIPSS